MSDDEIYEYLGETFEWDVDKARKNYMSHRVLFTEAATVSSMKTSSITKMKNTRKMSGDIL
jgi:uncharacterized DUF497 family protein